MGIVRNVLVRVGADLSEFQKNFTAAQKSMTKISKNLKKTGEKLTTAISLPLAGIGFAAIKTAADFEQGMSNIKAVSGATGEEMIKLKELAMQMGAETKYSASEAATGIEELIKAGLTTEQVLAGGLSGALALATAGELELGEAAEIASTALNAFKADNLSVMDAANILAGAANASATSVAELKFGLSAVSAVASAVGLTFNDTTTALAVFAQNGLKGSDAGTSLKTMLMNLQPSTKEQIALFKELGLTTADGSNKFFDQEGHLRSLSEIGGILQTSMAGLTDAQRLQKMETLFGSDAIRAANILYKEGETGVTNMKTAMSNVTAEEVAKEKLNNLNGVIEQMKGSLETAAIKIGEKFIPKIKEISEWINDVTNKFMELDPRTQDFIINVGLVAACIGPALVVIGSLISAIQAIGVAFAFLCANPIVAIIAAIALIVTAVITLYNTNEDFRNFVNNAWDAVKTQVAYIIGWWREKIDGFVKFFKDAWEKICQFLSWITGGVSKAEKETSKAASLAQPKITGPIDPGMDALLGNDVPGLASGGIVTGPTLAMIGEGRESEAVMPLSKLGDMVNEGNVINVYLDGNKIYSGIDTGLGRRLVSLGVG